MLANDRGDALAFAKDVPEPLRLSLRLPQGLKKIIYYFKMHLDRFIYKTLLCAVIGKRTSHEILCV